MKKQVLLAGAALSLVVGCHSSKTTDTYPSDSAYSTSRGTTTNTSTGSTGYNATTPTQNQSQTLASSDADFLREANRGNLEEVEIARVALRQTNNEQVRTFAQRMIDDHTRMNDEVMQLARQKGLSLDSQLPSDARNDVNRFAQMNGADFDRQYIRGMVQDHQKDADAFDRTARTATDSSVRSLASRDLPTIREHLRMAKDLDQTLTAPKLGQPRYGNPSNPSNPTYPGSPNNPNNPSNPGQPGSPTNPGTNPDMPGTPQPYNPVNPTPTNPDNPANPVNPSNPGTPENPR
jgi:putative membrane protein